MAPLTEAAVACAVALVTRQTLDVDIPREDVLGDVPPDDALAAMEAIASGVLKGAFPADGGVAALGRIGLKVADLTGQPLPQGPNHCT